MRITQIIEHKKGVRAVKSTVKPRNFVAKNAIQSGAGAHKDKKKAAKQGDVKHKAQAVAEGTEFGAYYNEQLAQKVFDENPNLNTSGRAEEVMKAGFKICSDEMGRQKAQGIFRDEDFPMDFVTAYGHLQKQNGQTEGIGDTISTVATKVGDTLASALPKEYRPFDNDTAAKNQQSMKVVKNEDSREYDDEVGMAENQLQTIQRCAREMEENLIDGENLPEWIQSKITIAKENLVTAFDYILSQHQNGEIAEASTNPDTMSATDYDRYQQGQMDSERRNFKRDEMEQELSHEDRGMYFVVIAKNGKWEHTKAQPRQEGMNAAQKVINALHAKYPSMHLGMQGPDGKVYNMGKGN